MHPLVGVPILFGGRDANGNTLDDTWLFQNGAWTLATPATKPSARSRHAMTPLDTDPIAAIATAPGRGGIGVVRVSGRGLSAVIDAVCGRALAPRTATLLPFRAADGGAIDTGLALHFPAPNSY
nr:kelch repeat-containing protein [Burkholderiaceae bacterium]